MRILSVLAWIFPTCLGLAHAAEVPLAIAVTVTADESFDAQLLRKLRNGLAGLDELDVVPREAADFGLDVIASKTDQGYVAAAKFSAFFTREMALRLLSAVEQENAAPLIDWLQQFEQERWRAIYAFPDPTLLAQRIVSDLQKNLENGDEAAR